MYYMYYMYYMYDMYYMYYMYYMYMILSCGNIGMLLQVGNRDGPLVTSHWLKGKSTIASDWGLPIKVLVVSSISCTFAVPHQESATNSPGMWHVVNMW